MFSKMQRFFSLEQLNFKRGWEARLQAKLDAIHVGRCVNAITKLLMQRVLSTQFFKSVNNSKFDVHKRSRTTPRPSAWAQYGGTTPSRYI